MRYNVLLHVLEREALLTLPCSSPHTRIRDLKVIQSGMAPLGIQIEDKLMTSPRKKHNIDSLDATRAVIASLNRQMADYRKLTNPPYLDAFNQLANTMELVRLQHIQMSQAWMSLAFDSVAYLTDISNSSRHLYDMFSQTGVALDSLNLVHDSWFERIRDIITYPSQLDAVVKSTLCDCSI